MEKHRVLVTGATGRIGAATVGALIEKNVPTTVLVRDPAKAGELLPPDVDTVAGDFDDSAALAVALQEVSAVLLVSPVHPDQCRLQGNVVRAAANNGRNPHIVKISGLGTSLDSYVDSGRWHAETERDISGLGLNYTFLRPLFFMQNLGFMLAGARADGVIRGAIGDSRIAMVDSRDIADIAVAALLGDPLLKNQAVTLTEDVAHSYAEVAEILSVILQREIKYERLSRADMQATLEARGEPAWHRRILDQFNRALLDGWGSEPTDTIRRVLQRPPRSLQAYLAEAAAASHSGAGKDPFPS